MRSGEANLGIVSKVVLDLGTEPACWDRLSVDSVRLGKMDLGDSPFDFDMIVGSLDHGRMVVDILLDSFRDPYWSHSSHCVQTVRIPAVDDLAEGQERADLVTLPVAYVAMFTLNSDSIHVVLD